VQRIFLLFLIFACATASAQVYRRVGPDGKVYFSDRPGPDAEKVEVAPAQAVRIPPARESTDAAAQQEEASEAYASFAVVSPASGEAVRANDGNVTIQLSLQPQLKPGHTIALKIDGEDGQDISTGEDLAIELTNMSRGQHSVEVTVVDDKGNALIQAGPVNFNVLRVAGGG
jgi:hypothetical protein